MSSKKPLDPCSRPGSSLVKHAVDALRRRILAIDGDDIFLGSAEQLIEELGVSRPTFQQAARLLEHEQLLTIRSGVHGGFFARLPSVAAVTRMAAIYLNAQGTTLQQIAAANSPVVEEAAAMLARTRDPGVSERLSEFLRGHAGCEDSDDEHHRGGLLEFESMLGELCGNPAIALVLNMTRDLVRAGRHDHFYLTKDLARIHADFHRQLVEAVLYGDADMARLLTRRHVARLGALAAEHAGGRPTAS